MGRSKGRRFQQEREEWIRRSSSHWFTSGVEGSRSPIQRGAPWSVPFRWRNLRGPLIVMLVVAAPFVVAILLGK